MALQTAHVYLLVDLVAYDGRVDVYLQDDQPLAQPLQEGRA